MKTTAPHKRDNQPKAPGFLDHLFYWLWYYTPSGGMPDRSFVSISLIRLVFLFLPFAVAAQFISDDTLLHVYLLTEGHPEAYLTILPFAFFVLWDMYRYKEKTYLAVQAYYERSGGMERLRHRRRFRLGIAATILAVGLDVWLFTLYQDRCIAIFREFSP